MDCLAAPTSLAIKVSYGWKELLGDVLQEMERETQQSHMVRFKNAVLAVSGVISPNIFNLQITKIINTGPVAMGGLLFQKTDSVN